MFSASPETNRWEPLELPPPPNPSSAGPGSLRFVHPVSLKAVLCCPSPAIFRRHEVSLLPVHGQQI